MKTIKTGTFEIVNIKLLNPSDINRAIDENHVHRFEYKLTQYGWLDPIKVDNNNNILEGHHRYYAALSLGVKNIPIYKVFWLNNLTEKERLAVILQYNASNLNWTNESYLEKYALLDQSYAKAFNKWKKYNVNLSTGTILKLYLTGSTKKFRAGESIFIDDSRLSKFLENGQNIVDVHGGKHPVYHSDVRDLAFDWIFYGKLPPNIDRAKLEADPNFQKHLQFEKETSMFHDQNFGNKAIDREIFKIMLRTMKGTNKVVSDTWDEKGSRNPEPMEIRKAFYDIQNFMVSPNDYIADKIVRRIGFLKSTGQDKYAERLMSEYIDTFYDAKYYAELRNDDGKQNLIRNILNGRDRQQRKTVFTLKNVKAEAPEAAFDMHIGGHVLKELVKMRSFWDENYGGVQVPDGMRNTDVFNAAGFFVKNVENFVETSRMHGIDLLAMDAGDIKLDITSFGNSNQSYKMKEALNNGILRELIHRQHGNLMNSLEYFSGERFVNPTKVDKIVERITNLQTAMKLMDKLAAQEKIIAPGKSQLLSVPRDFDKPFKKQKFKNLKDGQRVAVYSINGDVKPLIKGDKERTLFDHHVDNVKVDFSQLKFEGYYNNKGSIGAGNGYHKPGQPLRMQKGKTYYVDYNPKQRVSLSDKEIIYANALVKQTYNYNYDPEYLLGGRDTADFRASVRVLRAKIGMDFSETIDNSLSNKVLSINLMAFNILECILILLMETLGRKD